MNAPTGDRNKIAYVIDDEAAAATVVCKLLAAIGFKAEAFTAPAQFLVRAKTHPPDFAIVDLALGQSDAVEVIRQLEIIGFRGSVALISGRDQVMLDEIGRIGLRHGLAMLPSLRKPFRMDDLKKALAAQPQRAKVVAAHQRQSATQAEPRVCLEEALRERWLELWYQPKVDLKAMKVAGAEALVRARHPEFGIVRPAHFLPPAGDPLYLPLSRYVLRQALSDWSVFAAAGLPLKLAVNIPISVIQAPEFVQMVRQYLPPDNAFPGLIVELAEDEVVRDPELVHEISTQLRLYGISLSIDDFGTAYASLARVMELPCAELKIDRSFVSGCATVEAKRAVCQTVINLAHRFGISVCAEGVEQLSDLRSLIAMGCDSVQGFYFGGAMRPEAFVRHATAPASTAQNIAS